MTVRDVDIVVLGSGFGGSLLSLILKRLDYDVVLIDKGSHPRFAIGESSTPLADFVFSDLAQRYDLPEVLPLASYGTWLEHHPQLNCGLKRGFSYFHHRSGHPFSTDNENANQLLVAASSNDVDSDTHWFRADVDHFLFDAAHQSGVECLQDRTVESISGATGTQRTAERWCVEILGEPVPFAPRYIIDASGPAGVLLNQLGVEDCTADLKTNTRAIYSHFRGVRTFESVLADSGISTDHHPYPCDNAALHHVSADGWMWNLRFRDGTVSAGIVTTTAGPKEIADVEWNQWLRNHPSVAAQFAAATPVRPLTQTGQLQRLASLAAGTGWFALPNTVGFIDPLHSTGIAHTLSAVERIASLFEHNQEPDGARYASAIPDELRFIDEIIAGAYASIRSPNSENAPELFNAWCMVYFAAAHSCEMRRVRGERCFGSGFLGAGIADLRDRVERIQQRFPELRTAPDEFQSSVAEAIAPYNGASLFSPPEPNMYANTAPPRNLGSATD